MSKIKNKESDSKVNMSNLNNNNLNVNLSNVNISMAQTNQSFVIPSRPDLEENLIKIIITDDSIMIRNTMINLLKKVIGNKIVIKASNSIHKTNNNVSNIIEKANSNDVNQVQTNRKSSFFATNNIIGNKQQPNTTTNKSKNKNNQLYFNNNLMNLFNDIKENDSYSCVEIIECSDGIDTLKSVIEDQGKDLIKLIFTDENMEFMSGSDSANIIKKMIQDKKIKTIPIVSFTCFEDKDTKKRILDAGISIILSKPVSIGTLKETLKQFLGNSILIN